MAELNQREIILDILDEILEQGGYTHLVLSGALNKYQYLDKQQRAFITRVTEGTVERVLQLDYVIDSFVKKPKVRKMKPLIRTVLRFSTYQILHMDKTPDSAICNEAVKLVKKRGLGGLSGFVNGVLRNISRNKESIKYEGFSVRYSMPQWIIDYWSHQFDDGQLENILDALLQEKRTCIRVNTDMISMEDLKKSLEAQKIIVEPVEIEIEQDVMRVDRAYYISGYDYLMAIEEFANGYFYIQDVSSMMIGIISQVKPGSNVIDVCAAPGGKSLHIAELMSGTGHVQARDVSDYKVDLMEENISKSGLNNIDAICWDATVLDEDAIETADLVICDAPCSGLGVIAGKPDIKYHMSLEQLQDLSKLQRNILQNASKYVKVGGKIIYSTCTIGSMENEENVHWFLKNNEKFKLLQMHQLLPVAGKQDGFFFALLERL
ncbi:MAG: 16S rRNA (cytosine(967)-C(5))-methyltransferase RsmB [Lachnospiraceae bacterium]|nr:16S rRNA (cytosine(967)-C(5))-methyltransferase RsmB [Lachnospiraceae bacterium]